MDKLGLVLAGGGGKGAYQIGVWKYLRACGLDQRVSAVSGTSVGALNAALFVAGNYAEAESLWLNLAPQKILSPRKISPGEIRAWTGRTFGGPAALPAILLKDTIVSKKHLVLSLSSMLGRRYVFSREGLLELMREGIDFRKIQTSPLPCYATCFKVSAFSKQRFDLRNYSDADIQTILLASSAIPVVFDGVEFQGDLYYDGGIPVVGDNVPIAPLYDLGIKNILVVHLNQDASVDTSKFPGARLIEIVPQADLGGPLHGTLDFTSSGAAWRIEQGFHDAQAVLTEAAVK